ncbi:site-specific DNA-methyltransferase [Candidatus Woesearchaeota archaeon]|nr:site-specific DNA-methyltransferase [Candidatus Woesearchaeota archaeon]
MMTKHKILFQDARKIKELEDHSVDLMITSPPYPMIEMWDEMFSEQNPKIKEALNNKDGKTAFELMNQELDKVWDEVYRVLKPNGIACINIGDATRTVNGDFKLYPNSSRIVSYCNKIGFSSLPKILWKKTTNAPNKFMGSGMMPPGAYVTLEHEYILIFRKGGKREFKKSDEKINRRESSFFWEERNVWFSDIWEGLNGVLQKLKDEKIRDRSAAYPFELAYRLVNMFSVKGDVVLDPFFGTGTTMLAAMASARNSIGVEIDPNFENTILGRIEAIKEYSNKINSDRIKKHLEFVKKREEEKGPLKYTNEHYGFKVMTRQEKSLLFNDLKKVEKISDNEFKVIYSEEPQKEIPANNSPTTNIFEHPKIEKSAGKFATMKLSNFVN